MYRSAAITATMVCKHAFVIHSQCFIRRYRHLGAARNACFALRLLDLFLARKVQSKLSFCFRMAIPAQRTTYNTKFA